ncbi:hypothetical protein WBP07_23210 [Novosphingobium sp. BL-8A]
MEFLSHDTGNAAMKRSRAMSTAIAAIEIFRMMRIAAAWFIV